jgi:site-specific recombinase XerD
MAFSYVKRGSPWYFIRYKNEDGKWRSKATRYRIDNTLHRAKAVAEAARLGVHENTAKCGHDWVNDLIENHPVSSLTKVYYLNSWKHLERFIYEKKISLQAFSANDCEIYLKWRQNLPRTSGGQAGRNQACQDLKILKWIHRQGRLLGKMDSVALLDYRIKRGPIARVKPVFSDNEIKIVRKALSVKGVPEWMKVSFEIALATGCRLRETQIPLSCVDLKNRILTFPCPKGGTGKSFSIPIPAAIEPMLTAMKAGGRELTCEVPRTRASLCWRRLLDICGLKRHCFHSLRVTRVTRLRLAGCSQSVAMRLVNHSSTLVHELYQRHCVEDLRDAVNVGQPAPSAIDQSRSELPFPRLGEIHAFPAVV